MRRWWILPALWLAAPAGADPIVLSKSVTGVSDPMGSLSPRLLPGAVADYKTIATNPNANLTRVVKGLVLTEPLPAGVSLRVTDLAGAGKGPVELSDLNLLGTGLLASGMSIQSVDYNDGTAWGYRPVADAKGYDVKVRAIRVTLAGTFATGASFQLRYRVTIR